MIRILGCGIQYLLLSTEFCRHSRLTSVAAVELVVELMELPAELDLAMRSRWKVGRVRRSVTELVEELEALQRI